MPVTIREKYSHIRQYSTGELSLQARRKHERRFMPGAYVPTSATISIEREKAKLEVEYSVKETQGSSFPGSEGVTLCFGKFTRKVIEIAFEYASLGRLMDQLTIAAEVIRAQQNSVPQDSIKRNYQIVADLLLLLREHVEPDLSRLEGALSKDGAAA